MHRVILVLAICVVSACASAPQVVVDPRSIKNESTYQQDMTECHQLALSYDKSTATATNTVIAGTAGGTAVAGVATAISGAVFAPAIPFIAAGAIAAGTLGGGLTKSGETASREKILAECLTDRGYRAYSPNY